MKIFDGHADILHDIALKRKLGYENIFEKFHSEKFKKGEVMGGIFAAWLNDSYKEEEWEKEMIYMITSSMFEINNNKNLFHIIKNKGDFEKGLKSDKFNVLLGVEGLKAIGKNLDWLDMLYNLGFRHATLTWNEKNLLASGAKSDEDTGLSPLGEDVVKKMNSLGMIVDVSHASEKTFWDIVNTTSKPIIASHSNAKTLCNHVRNLSDEQIKAIANLNGVIGVVACNSFINPVENEADLNGFVDHIDYMVKIAGINHVGLGFDFCEYLPNPQGLPYSNPKNLNGASEAQNVIKELKKRGYSQEEIEKIAYKNFMRVIDEILL